MPATGGMPQPFSGALRGEAFASNSDSISAGIRRFVRSSESSLQRWFRPRNPRCLEGQCPCDCRPNRREYPRSLEPGCEMRDDQNFAAIPASVKYFQAKSSSMHRSGFNQPQWSGLQILILPGILQPPSNRVSERCPTWASQHSRRLDNGSSRDGKMHP